jgi:ABC-type lipoprotein export system ATPase subunit
LATPPATRGTLFPVGVDDAWDGEGPDEHAASPTEAHNTAASAVTAALTRLIDSPPIRTDGAVILGEGAGISPSRRRPVGAFSSWGQFRTVRSMIAAHSLAKHYGKTVAVSNLSFEVTPGVVTGFLGPNGSGKSTTMRMIMGLDTPTAGAALVNGTPYSELRWPLREVGALLDAKAFHPFRSACNHLLILTKTNDIPRRRIDEVLDVVGLTSVAHDRAGKYSLGMGQRLRVAGALLGDPAVLLFDEPHQRPSPPPSSSPRARWRSTWPTSSPSSTCRCRSRTTAGSWLFSASSTPEPCATG